MAMDIRPQTPTVLRGAYACDLAADGDGRVFGAWAGSDWAEESLFGLRSWNSDGHWQFAPGHDERDFLQRLGVTRYRLRAGHLDGDDLNPIELTQSPTVLQDPAVATRGDLRHVSWGEKRNGGFAVMAWNGADVELVAQAPASLTRPAAAIDTDGRAWVAWQAFGDNGCVVMLSRREPGGWTAPAIVSVPGDSAWRPALHAAADGGVWLAWDAWLGHHFHVHIRNVRPDGSAGEVMQLSQQPLLAMDADISVDPDGRRLGGLGAIPTLGRQSPFQRKQAAGAGGRGIAKVTSSSPAVRGAEARRRSRSRTSPRARVPSTSFRWRPG